MDLTTSKQGKEFTHFNDDIDQRANEVPSKYARLLFALKMTGMTEGYRKSFHDAPITHRHISLAPLVAWI